MFKRAVFDWLDADCILERGPLDRLAKAGQLALYPHHGFWYCMDTYKGALGLNEMWARGETPWVIWK